MQRYIDTLIEKQLLENLPKFSWYILPYGQRKLEEVIRVLKGDYGLRVFMIADNDDQGRKDVERAKKMGLREDEVFITNKKDILCYIKPEDLVNALVESLKEYLGDEYKTVMQDNEIKSIIDEIGKYGACKNREDMLHRLSGKLFQVLQSKNKNLLDTLGWVNGRLIERALKEGIAEKVKLTEVPDDIRKIILNIDREMGVAYGGKVI